MTIDENELLKAENDLLKRDLHTRVLELDRIKSDNETLRWQLSAAMNHVQKLTDQINKANR